MPNPENNSANDRVTVIASEKNWIVGDALTQLRRAAELPHVVRAVGMPDLHPGKGGPVGAAILSEGAFYPHLAGNDIGCGMAFWQVDLPSKKRKLDRWVKKLKRLDSPPEEPPAECVARTGLDASRFDRSLGTIGGGNHFAELQAIESVEDEEAFENAGLDSSYLMLAIHSGSRGLGESTLRRHLDAFGPGAVPDDGEAARDYRKGHDHACRWARLNRTLIAERFVDALGTSGRFVLDLCHNSIEPIEHDGRRHWLHRKGAAPSEQGILLLPGSRGTLSYLLMPEGSQEANLFSVAHGAGRKWARSDAKGRLEKRYTPETLRQTELGGRVICNNKELLYEEAPQAYKKVEVVVGDLVDAGLVHIVATMRPLISYKTGGR